MNGRDYGVRMGIGGVASSEMRERHRQSHLNRVVNEVFQFDKDPYMIKTDLGIIECKLCTTTHKTTENYLLHTQGKKHKENLAVRQFHLDKAKEREEAKRGNNSYHNMPQQMAPATRKIQKPRVGQPKCSVIQQYHPTEGFHALAIKLEYPLIDKGMKPRYRIVNPYEQEVENPDENFQYLVFAAEPYENVAVKIPNVKLDMTKVVRDWDPQTCQFLLQIKFRDGFFERDRKRPAATTASEPNTMNDDETGPMSAQRAS